MSRRDQHLCDHLESQIFWNARRSSGAQHRPRTDVRRIAIQLLERSLLDDAAIRHHHQPVGEACLHFWRVADQQN